MLLSSLIVCISYIAAQMLSDIGSLQIVSLFGFSLDAGTFIYPITFTLRDMAHKVLGKRLVRVLIIAAALVNIIMALYFWLVSLLTPDLAAGSSTAWGEVLAPVWRITGASIIAEVLSELFDTEVYHFWVTKITQRFQWMRVLLSNLFSVPMDSFIFSFLAFYGQMPAEIVWQIFWGNVLVKGLVTVLSLPMIYMVKDKPDQPAIDK